MMKILVEVVVVALAVVAVNGCQFVTVSGTHNYITFEVGGANTNVIISASHGGTMEPISVSSRPSKGCYDAADGECVYTKTCGTTSSQCAVKTSADSNTALLAQEMAEAIQIKLGGQVVNRPHVIINNLHRSKLDANRDLAEATFGDPEATKAWYEYHGFIDDAKHAVTAIGRRALYIDVHGQNQSEGWSMVGVLLSNTGSNGLGKNLIRDRVSQYSSIKQLHHDTTISMEELVRGHNSIGGLLQAAGYNTVPSPTNKDAGSAKYYQGGYSLRRHTGWTVSGFQMEVHYDIRKNAVDRKNYAMALADAIISWINDYY